MTVHVKEAVPEPSTLPVQEVVFESSLGTRVLRFRRDSHGAKRVTVTFQRFANRAASLRTNPIAQTEMKTSAYPQDIRDLAAGLVRLADTIEGK